MILVTGAAGKTGKTVISKLAQKGQPVRAFVRNAGHAESVYALGVQDAVQGDLLDQADLKQAFNGVDAVYHICPNMHPQETLIGQYAIWAAQAVGVSHFVYHSVLHPQIEAMPHHWNKMRVEETLIESGVPFTILQPTAYMQNILARLDEIRHQGIYRVPYSIRAVSSLVDVQDVAEAAAKILTEQGYKGGIFELVGPDDLDQIGIAEILSRVIGREVTAEQTPISEWQENAQKAGLGKYAIETLIKMFDHYGQFGLKGNAKVLEYLLGRKPRNLKEVFERELNKKGAA